ncbi:MAG: hypothetical protein GY778_03030 [bacterium]|nr:hypothetical protein [bacterium]
MERPANDRAAGSGAAASFILTEVVAALALTGALLAVLAALVVTYHRASDHYFSHHQAQLAAESYVERLQADCPPPPEANGIRYEVNHTPGRGAWTGLTRLTVTAMVKTRHRRTAGYTLTTYLQETAP